MIKRLTKLNCLFLAGLVALFYSCQKSGETQSNAKTVIAASAITSSQAIMVTPATTTAGITTDAVYAVHAYPPGLTIDSVAFASLPAAISTYLTTTYTGYIFVKAYKVLTSAGATDSYVVVVTLNGKPVALKFDSTGTFVKVLEQCEGHDLGNSQPWHDGGRFGYRDCTHKDTVATTALPTAVTLYFSSYYPTDTLLHATINTDGSYLVLSADKGLYATSVTSLGSVIKRMEIYPHPNNCAGVAESALLPVITTYLTTTFPGYVFDEAFAEKEGSTVLAYDVFINVNAMHQAVEFDGAGKFIKMIVIR